MAGYGGDGGNPGSPSEAGMFADGRAWLAALERLGVPGHAAVLYGESLGSGVVVELAVGTAVAGVVLEAPYPSLADLEAVRSCFVPARHLVLDPFATASPPPWLRDPLRTSPRTTPHP